MYSSIVGREDPTTPPEDNFLPGSSIGLGTTKEIGEMQTGFVPNFAQMELMNLNLMRLEPISMSAGGFIN